MARDSSGTHSLPAGNPVVSGNTISSTVHNNTLSDISAELTDSLSRSGKGAMTAALELANGTVAAPALSFDSDVDSGIYRIGANNIGVAANGAKVLDVATTGLAVTGTLSSTGALTASTTLAVTGTSALTGAATLSNGAVVTQATADTDGIAVTGNGTADGIQATGGSTSGAGVRAAGGAPNGHGVVSVADGTGRGIDATGGDSSGAGVVGTGGAPNGNGGEFTGDGTGKGGTFVGGDSNGTGLTATGGATNGKGAVITGTGTGTALDVVGSNVGISVNSPYGINVVQTTGYGLEIASGDGTYSPFRITGTALEPTNGDVGALYFNTGTGKLYVCTVAGAPATWVALH